MDLSGRNVLIAGGAGLIGTAVTQELLAKGAKVMVTTRSMERFEAMKKKLPAEKLSHVSAIQADVKTEEGVAAIFTDSTKQPGGVQHVIASIGSWWQGGKLVEQPLEEFNTCIKDRVTGHFLLFKAFADYLEKQKGATYTMLTGGAGDYYMAPGISLLCITSGALHGLSTAARAELKDSALRFCDFRIHLMVLDKRDADLPQVDNHQLGSDVVAKAIVQAVANRTHDRKDVYCRQDATKLATA